MRGESPTAITPEMAEAAIAAEMSPFEIEERSLEQSIGQTLRQDIFAERDNPPFDRVCMDGIAIDSGAALERGIRRFAIRGSQPAGVPPLVLSSPDDAIEVMTGAVLPSGTDCVIPQERLPLAARVNGRAMAYFLPVSVHYDSHGRPAAVPRPTNGPGDFLGLTAAQGFVELPPSTEGFPEGFVANMYRW